MDLADYVNETMEDNAYPLKNGVETYINNLMNEREQDLLYRTFLERAYDYHLNVKSTIEREEWVESELP